MLSSLEISQHCLLLCPNVINMMEMETQKRKGSPLVVTNQPGWWTWQEPTSLTTPNHTLGKQNDVAQKETIALQEATRLHAQAENQIPKLSEQTGRRQLSTSMFIMWPNKSGRDTQAAQNATKTSIKTGNSFLCLDTELVFATNGDLQFGVHLESNKPLKCANANIIHTKACFKAIPSGVCKRLSELTTITKTNKNAPAAGQNLPTTLLSSATQKSSHQRNPNIDRTPTTQ